MFLCFQKHAKGQELFANVCDHLNLLEKDYYGLVIWETPTIKVPQSVSTHLILTVGGIYLFFFLTQHVFFMFRLAFGVEF